MFELFDQFSEEIIVTFFAFMTVIIPTGIFIVVKCAKEAGKQKEEEEEENTEIKQKMGKLFEWGAASQQDVDNVGELGPVGKKVVRGLYDENRKRKEKP